MTVALWIVVPYVALTVFVIGHIWRWRTGQFGWTSRSSQILEGRLQKVASPLFHLGVFAVVAGHILGLLVPESWTEAVGVPEGTYHLVSAAAGTIAGAILAAGLVLLLIRRFANPRVRRATTRMDVVLFTVMSVVIALGITATVGSNLLGGGYDYRTTVAVWFRGIFVFHPDAGLMARAPLIYQAHVLSAWVLIALWPFTRLVHVWSAPLAYLWRPPIVYRRRTAVPPRPPAPPAVPPRPAVPAAHPATPEAHPAVPEAHPAVPAAHPAPTVHVPAPGVNRPDPAPRK